MSATIVSATLAQCCVIYTFAISFQLFPASLMLLSLRSSAGVHGVFVRLFFATGLVLDSPVSRIPPLPPVPPGSPYPEVEAVDASAVVMGSTCLRLRELGDPEEVGTLS